MKLTDVTPNLIVADIDRSTAFYRDVLDFSIVTTVPEAAPFVFVWLQRDGVNVYLNAPDGSHVPALGRPVAGTATLFMTLEAETPAAGVDALFERIGSKARVVMPLVTQFYGMREFGIEDPDGYIIFLAQPVA
jgi:lactoylglutathione lyase